MKQTNSNLQRDTETMSKDVFSFINRISLILDNDKGETVSRTFDLSNKVYSSYNEYLFTAPYYINIFAELNLLEPQTSSIISAILQQKYKGKYNVLQSFVESFLPNFPIDSIQSPEIICEFRHIDICIKEAGRYAIIIENKSRKAPFQKRQIARYIESLRDEGFNDEQIYVVIMPPDKEYNTKVSCIWHTEINLCYKCPNNIFREECDDSENYRTEYEDRYVDVPLYPEFYNWLEKLEIREEDVKLKQAIQLLAEYIYYLQTNNSKEKMKKIEDIIKEELKIGQNSLSDLSKLIEKLNELNEVCEGLEKIILETTPKNFSSYEKELRQKFPNNEVLQRTIGTDKTVGVNIKIRRSKIYVLLGADNDGIFVGAAPIEGANRNENITALVREKIQSLWNIERKKLPDYYFWYYLDFNEYKDPTDALLEAIEQLQN